MSPNINDGELVIAFLSLTALECRQVVVDRRGAVALEHPQNVLGQARPELRVVERDVLHLRLNRGGAGRARRGEARNVRGRPQARRNWQPARREQPGHRRRMPLLGHDDVGEGPKFRAEVEQHTAVDRLGAVFVLDIGVQDGEQRRVNCGRGKARPSHGGGHHRGGRWSGRCGG